MLKKKKVPVFVVDWPASCKPFYAKELPGCDPSKVDAVDLLVPSVGELVGGSLREHRCPTIAAILPCVSLGVKFRYFLEF